MRDLVFVDHEEKRDKERARESAFERMLRILTLCNNKDAALCERVWPPGQPTLAILFLKNDYRLSASLSLDLHTRFLTTWTFTFESLEFLPLHD